MGMKRAALPFTVSLWVATACCSAAAAEIAFATPARTFGPGEVSDPADPRFPRVPVNVILDISATDKARPELKIWSAITPRLCEQWYSVICACLGENDVPHKVILRVVAGTGGHAEDNVITVGVQDILRNPTDYGAVIHELTHVVQGYRYGWFRNKGVGWLVEGIADYVRFYAYETDPKYGEIRLGKSQYCDGYRTTASFLDYIVRVYDGNFVKKLHRALRAGIMNPDVFDRMLATDADVPVSRRETRAELFEHFLVEWQSKHGASAAAKAPG
jgi:hypothetical protein